MTNTTTAKTSPNAVAVRGKIRENAINAYEAIDKASSEIAFLANSLFQSPNLVDIDREEVDELHDDLIAAQYTLSRLQAKAGLIARRTKTIEDN